jgi:hypothetical protein
MADIHHSSRQQLTQQVGITFARSNAACRYVLGCCLWGIAFDDKQAGRGHRLSFQVPWRMSGTQITGINAFDMAVIHSFCNFSEYCGSNSKLPLSLLEYGM